MGVIAAATHFVERTPLPDFVTRAGVDFLVGRTRRSFETARKPDPALFAAGMHNYPIAEHTAEANDQHYEIPPAFFAKVLGPRRKYSSCIYPSPDTTLAEAEIAALKETSKHADLQDGQRVLELGCGWGSLTLWMAEHFPASTIVAVSNSAPQRLHIEAEAKRRGLANVTVVTADMNVFSTDATFDRIVSVEMFEHMANWRALLERVAGWLAPDGRVFIHVFTHRDTPYRFDHANKADWIAQHFFTGGIMPSHGLIRNFPDLFSVEDEWQWSGAHYARTANDWLANFDKNYAGIEKVLRPVYGDDTALWMRRWRLFFMATAGLFGHAGGSEWGVSHYRLKRP